MRKIITTFLGMLIFQMAWSQGLSDALRFSITTPGGTARTIGAGGAFGALGGDFGSISINPAGLGTYRASEFVISPGLQLNEATSIMQGTNEGFKTEEDYLGLENLGIVLSHRPIGSDWFASNLAIGFNKVANFHNDFYFEGTTIGTITERFVELADGLSVDQLDDFEAYPAYATGAIFDFEEDQLYETDLSESPDQQVFKRQSIRQRGSTNELSFTWAGNYKNKMNIGFGVGIPFTSFEEIKTYEESDIENEIEFFDDLTFNEYLNTSGTGINVRGGFIFTPSRLLRVGMSFQSPTWYFLTDDYFTDLTYAFTDSNGAQEYTEESPQGNFRYRFTTPWIITASAGTIYSVGDINGFFSADLEYRDYTDGSFNLASYSNDPDDRAYGRALNEEINSQLASAATLRLGTELAFQNLRLRGGLQIRQSYFEIDDKATDSNISLGIGFRADRFFLDIAYVGDKRSEGYIPYLTSDESRNQFVENDYNTDKYVLTLGYKF